MKKIRKYLCLLLLICLITGCQNKQNDEVHDYFKEVYGEYQVTDEDIGTWWHLSILKHEGNQYLTIYDNGAGNPGVEGPIQSIDDKTIVVQYDEGLFEQLPSDQWSKNGKSIVFDYKIVDKGIELTNNNFTIFFEKEPTRETISVHYNSDNELKLDNLNLDEKEIRLEGNMYSSIDEWKKEKVSYKLGVECCFCDGIEANEYVSLPDFQNLMKKESTKNVVIEITLVDGIVEEIGIVNIENSQLDE